MWTSLGHDGAREGVYGQLITPEGTKVGGEMRVNTTTASIQFQPTVGADEQGHALVVWSSFVGGAGSFDLMAQQYGSTRALRASPAPVVTPCWKTEPATCGSARSDEARRGTTARLPRRSR